MSQPVTSFDLGLPVSRLLEALHDIGIASLSSMSGTAEPPSDFRFPYGLWADDTVRVMRQYCRLVADGSRALWTLQSGPYAIIPRTITGNFTLPNAIGGASAFTTWALSDTGAGAHTVTLPVSAQSPNSIIAHLLQSGANKATLSAQGSDTIRDATGSSTTTSLELRSVGDLVVLYTLGQGHWRVLDDRRAGVLMLAATGSISVWDHVVACDATGGAFTATLPDPARLVGRSKLVTKVDGGGNAVTVATAAGTINGAASISLTAAYQSARCTSIGSGWIVG